MTLNHLSGMHMDNVLIRSKVGIPVWFSVMGWLITFINIIANSVLIFIIRKHFLESTHNWLIFSLATADLLIGVSVFPSIFFCNYSESFECNGHTQLFVYSSLIYVSVSSVATTIFGHYIIIASPLKYATMLTSSRIWTIILLSWVIPLVLGLLPLTWDRNTSVDIFEVTEKYFACMLVLFEIVPFCVFLWISIHLIKIVRSQKIKIQAQCNVHGRLSPHLEQRTSIGNALSNGNMCEAPEVSKNVYDNVFLVWNNTGTNSEHCNGLTEEGLPTEILSPTTSTKQDVDAHVQRLPSRFDHLYSLNSWLPPIPRRLSRGRRTSLETSDFTSSLSLPNPNDLLNRIRIRQFRDQRRRATLITCLLIVFMFCYALTFANASCVFSKHCDKIITSTDFKIITLFFEILNSALNPILFMSLGKDLRRKVLQLFRYNK